MCSRIHLRTHGVLDFVCWKLFTNSISLLVIALSPFSIWRRQWQPTPVLLPGKSHGWRSLVGCSPWGCTESDTTEGLHFHISLSCIGEGNGNPFQCSCLENPRDGGAWRAAVDGVAQSQTWLKWLSSSSSSSSSSIFYFFLTQHWQIISFLEIYPLIPGFPILDI